MRHVEEHSKHLREKRTMIVNWPSAIEQNVDGQGM
jgi:hypothetical protein